MKIITQIGVLFGVCLGGVGISAILPFPFPASVSAMLLLFALLLCRVVKPGQIDEIAGFLTKNMAILFLPAAVGIIESLDILRDSGIQILIICLVSTLLTFGVTATVVSLLMRLADRKERQDG
ncbi:MULTISPECIES: CidA/LrgA family protein [unclassified Anaerotruncus]|jgi:holin-like protein|uniref:CidA/LrgA family protein n=1 Tax=unclassified Anaerotruncus TaxID=2641626 RepID=UPI0003381EBD|nr:MULTISPECIES: CidA/LrgA family protein [unclassified Anaerotruncus]MCI9160615.1 CidA/LrgA family protein [Anaerotruncus sp.]NCE75018.1 CidA/LrgA family protein [Anaerotruncus sp. X29]RKJ93943.1 CidA/LrgA family protein [Anaerotruncus sp. 1XD22-93]EOS58623.1 hypothetical protein C814_02266 [Anaerotruncus sp. G3(2012)]MCI9235414.1 CidA/LrgA family protein [Anaerotruncus sp.]